MIRIGDKGLSARSVIQSAAILFLILSTSGTAAETPADRITAHFDSLQSIVAVIARASQTRSTNLKTTDQYFASIMKQYPQIHDLLRVNTKGSVTNELARDGKKGQKLRSVAGQDWYKSVVSTRKPSFGKARTGQGDYLLLWAHPLLAKTSSGTRRQVGTLLVKLDLVKCLEGAAARVGEPFEITLDGTSLYNNELDKEARVSSEDLKVPGVEGLSVRTRAAEPEPEVPAATPAVQIPRAGVPQPAQPAAVAPAPVQPAQIPARPAGRAPLLVALAAALLVVLAGIAAVILIARIKQLRRIRKIDEEVAVERRERSEAGLQDGRQFASKPKLGPDQQTIEAQALSSAATVVMRRANVPFPPGMAATPQQPVYQSRPYAQAGVPAISSADYERLRQQIREDTLSQIRVQMEQQCEAFRRQVKEEAESFAGQVIVGLQDLVRKLSLTDGDPINVVTTVSNAMKEISQTVENYRRR